MSDAHTKNEYHLSAVTDRILAAAIQVHKNLGPGFEEIIYQRALALELGAQGLNFTREEPIIIYYRDKKVGKKRVDFIISFMCGLLKQVIQVLHISISHLLKIKIVKHYTRGSSRVCVC